MSFPEARNCSLPRAGGNLGDGGVQAARWSREQWQSNVTGDRERHQDLKLQPSPVSASTPPQEWLIGQEVPEVTRVRA